MRSWSPNMEYQQHIFLALARCSSHEVIPSGPNLSSSCLNSLLWVLRKGRCGHYPRRTVGTSKRPSEERPTLITAMSVTFKQVPPSKGRLYRSSVQRILPSHGERADSKAAGQSRRFKLSLQRLCLQPTAQWCTSSLGWPAFSSIDAPAVSEEKGCWTLCAWRLGAEASAQPLSCTAFLEYAAVEWDIGRQEAPRLVKVVASLAVAARYAAGVRFCGLVACMDETSVVHRRVSASLLMVLCLGRGTNASPSPKCVLVTFIVSHVALHDPLIRRLFSDSLRLRARWRRMEAGTAPRCQFQLVRCGDVCRTMTGSERGDVIGTCVAGWDSRCIYEDKDLDTRMSATQTSKTIQFGYMTFYNTCDVTCDGIRCRSSRISAGDELEL